MKIATQPLASRLLSAVVLIILLSCDAAHDISVFDQRIAIDAIPRFASHDERFLKASGLRELHYTLVSDLSQESLSIASRALLSGSTAAPDSFSILFIYIYTSIPDGGSTVISASNTHAFSIVGVRDEHLEHSYYEKPSDGSFQRVSSIPSRLDGPLSMDEIRLLHFAAADSTVLPEHSTIFELRSSLFAEQSRTYASNRLMVTSLLLDATRNAGASTIGMYGDALYAALADDGNPGSGSCGNAQLCPPGGNGTCVPSDIAGYRCELDGGGGGGGGGCVTAQLPALSQALGLDMAVPIDFRGLRAFRDEFLLKSEAGRRYVSYLYVFSQFAKTDLASLTRYIEIIAPLQASMNNLMSGTDDRIILDQNLMHLAAGIIDEHQDIENDDFQKILSRMRIDLERLSGLSKTEFVRVFESLPEYQKAQENR